MWTCGGRNHNTVSVNGLELMLPDEAVISVVPAATPVASPPGLVIVATPVLLEVQVAVLVIS